jgi:hypothetical protein
MAWLKLRRFFNIVSYPLADILIYGISLCISAPFLIAILALHDTVESRKRLWTSGALLFGVMYVTYVALMYTVQLSVVIPKSMGNPSGSVLDVAPQTLFWVIDGLGYVSTGILLLGAPWLITAPGSLLALASYFRMIECASVARSKDERSHP